MNIEPFRRRRERVLDALAAAGGGVAIQMTAPEAIRNRDAEYPFRHDSYFYYLTGFPEPEAVVVLSVGPAGRRSVLFCREKDAAREIWDGFRHGPEGAATTFGFDETFAVASLDETMPALLADAPAVFRAFGGEGDPLDAPLKRWLTALRQRRDGVRAPHAQHDLHRLLDEMRLVKDDSELATMRGAARISAQAHRRALQACRPGKREYEIEAELLYEFRRNGAQSPAYTSVVAAGPNACVLHYSARDAVLRDGDLCLIDAGCELDGYASDITRTFPVSGRFSAEQRAVYEIVLAAQAAALAEVRPGSSWNAPHDAATRVLAQGMRDLGLLDGSVDGILESGAYRQFYMHRTGHWLGMDVHDVGDYRDPAAATAAADGGAATDRQAAPWRPLAPGMVLTVEPGMYLRPAPNVPARFEHIGVRIEDDVAVTTDGHEVLSVDAPKAVADIEALVGR
jgi:Xaa-Pro aminopeptidase